MVGFVFVAAKQWLAFTVRNLGLGTLSVKEAVVQVPRAGTIDGRGEQEAKDYKGEDPLQRGDFERELL